MSIFFKNGSYIKTIPVSGEARRFPRTKVYLLKEGYEMTNFEWVLKKISKMTPSELALYIDGGKDDFNCDVCDKPDICTRCDCINARIQWYNQPHRCDPVVQHHLVQASRSALYCDCGTEMVRTGESDVAYHYECPNCGAVHSSPHKYPVLNEVKIHD